MTDNNEKDPKTTTVSEEITDGPEGPHKNNKEEQERLQKRIEELRKRDPFIYR